jgi:hypothetical protein
MLRGGREIYKNLRWPEDHGLPGVIGTLSSSRENACLYIGANVGRIFFVSREVAGGLVSQQDAKVAKIISGGPGDDGVA